MQWKHQSIAFKGYVLPTFSDTSQARYTTNDQLKDMEHIRRTATNEVVHQNKP